MSGTDPMQAALLVQMRNQNRRPSTQARLAEQMMASLNNNTPIFGTGPAIARAGSGMMAGLMSALADRQDREREDRQLQQAQDRADKRSYLNDAAFNTAMGRAPQQPPQMAEEAPQMTGGPAVPYGRNAGLVAQRDALLDAPPDQLVQASAQRSAAGGVPEMPGGYRANPGLEGAFNGAPAPTGRVMPLTGPGGPGGAPSADMLRQRIEALTPLVGNDPRAVAAIQSAERELARIEGQRIRQEDRQFMQANRPAAQPDELTSLFAAAGIDPGSEEGRRLARSMLERRVSPNSEVRAGLNPVQAYDAEGNPTILLPRTDGTVTRPAMPDGVTLTPRTREINTGTEILTVDQGGRVLQRRPMDVAGREAEERVGQQRGSDIAAAPQALRTADQSLQAIDGIMNHPALRLATGATAFTGALPGTPMMDFRSRVEQLQGQAFLQAFESLRGGGAITEIEGRKATDAIARLNRSVSAADFRQALGEVRDVIAAGRERAQARMPRDNAAPPGSPANPAPGPAAPRLRFNPATGDFE